MSLNKRILLPLLTVALLVIQLMSPLSALADGETPPETSDTEIVTPTEETETVSSEPQVVITEETLVDEVPAPEAVEEPAPATEKTQSEEVDTPADLTVAEALEQAPAGTEIVVINEEGEVEPLVTEEAAQIVAIVDPMWCPAGVTTVTADCENDTTVAGLLAKLTGKNEPGIIYFTPTYTTDDATFDGTNPNIAQLADDSLTLQGGWDGVTTSGTTITYSGVTTFDRVPLTITNWNANVTLRDIVVDGAASTGITVETSGDINLENVQSNNNTGNGATLDNTSGTGAITLTGTNIFNGNTLYGLYAESKGDISLENVTAGEDKLLTGNGKDGVYLSNDFTGTTSKVTLTGTNIFNGNGSNDNRGNGLTIVSKGNISLNNITAGLDYSNSNYFIGVSVNTTANISINNITAINNAVDGAYLYNGGAGAPQDTKITITGTNTFNNNSNGLTATANGDITLSNITVNTNGSNGLFLNSNGGTIQLDGVNTLDKNGMGLIASTGGGNIILSNLTVSNTGVDGANLTTIGAITISCSAFNSNTGYGFEVESNPGPSSLTLNGVTFDGLNGSGDYNFSDTLVENPDYDCNPGGGGKKTIIPTYPSLADKKAVGSPSLPVNPVNASIGATELNCTEYKGTQLNLPNGDYAYFPCPISDSASVSALEPENLPEGVTALSGFSTAVTKNGTAISSLPAYATLSFVIPAGVDPASLAILFWNGSEWVAQSGFVSADGLSFQTAVNFSGDFVLVNQ